MSVPLASVVLLALVAVPPSPGGPSAVTPDSPPVSPGRELEARDPGARLVPKPLARTDADDVIFGPFINVQVNIDAAGMNIAGDAGNEPSIAVDPTAPNRMAAGWRQFDSITSSFRQAGVAWSEDGGRTWSPQSIIEPGVFRSDPVLAATPDGRFHYLSLEVTGDDFFCDVFISEDGGQTWPSKTFAYGADKAWIVVDDRSDEGFGSIYQATNFFGNMFQPGQVNRSLDGGASFSFPVAYTPDLSARPIFGQCAVGPDGALYTAGWENQFGPFSFRVTKSAQPWLPGDGPVFDQFTFVDLNGRLGRDEGPNPDGLLGQVEIAVDASGGPRDGWIYVLASVIPNDDSDPMEVRLIRSEDGGLSFSDPRTVNDGGAIDEPWNWMGTMGVAPNGRIDVVYVESRSSAQSNLGDLRYTASEDGGDTWTPSVAVGPEFDSFLGFPVQQKIGDYFQVRSDEVGADVIYAATYNGEQDVWYVRVGDRDCDGNGIPDAEDLAAGTLRDCDADGVPDVCAIAAGAVPDADGDGVPDSCITCFGDVDGSGEVGFGDLSLVLATWGPCGGTCPTDLDRDGSTGLGDLLAVLAAWGPCSDRP